jgi:hypothetical protein
MRRILVLLALTTVGLVASVTTAQAEIVTNERTLLAYSGFVPCANGGAGELVTGTIDVQSLTTSTVNDNNVSWQFQFQPHGSLVGSLSGHTYRLTGVTRGTYHDAVQNGRYALTYVNSYQLIGPGAGNNLLVRETAHVTIDGDDVHVEHDDLRIQCQ